MTEEYKNNSEEEIKEFKNTENLILKNSFEEELHSIILRKQKGNKEEEIETVAEAITRIRIQ